VTLPSPPRSADSVIDPSSHRIHTLDVLRGLALLGMIVVHFHNHTLEIVTGVDLPALRIAPPSPVTAVQP
jgi:uncharacterized membrane protein